MKTETVIAEHDQSLLEQTGDLTFSTFKSVDSVDHPGETVLRLFNPNAHEALGTIKWGNKVSEIMKCGLNEKDESILGRNLSELALKLQPWQIMTVKIRQ